MHTSSHQLSVIDCDGSALQFLSNNSFASRSTTRLAINHDRPESAKEVDDEYFAALVAHCPNLVALHLRAWHFDSVRPHLLAECSFSRLESLTISCEATLSVTGFFGMLSVMPALKRLWMGRVEDDYESGSDSGSPVRTPDASFATPACSLTHLVVGDDWSINFWHYEHLLSRSHDTLEHLELHWIYDDGVGDAVARALEGCTRVRHLSLIGNDFTNERIIAAAGATVGSLTLVGPPTDVEFAAMRAPLRALELVNCYVVDPESFVASAWKNLRDRLPMAPTLSRIRFSLMRRPVSPEDEGLRRLRNACKERRIVLSLHPGLHGVAF